MNATDLEDAIPEFRQFLRTNFPQISYGIQSIGPTVPAPQSDEALVLSPNAVPKRRMEFAAGRHAARVALKTLGHSSISVGKGENGQPIWPNNTIGSITHTEDLAIAVAATNEDFTGIGIDLELVQRFRPDIADAVLTAGELSRVEEQNELAAHFSAKEATYKAIFGSLRKVIGFQDVELEFDSNLTSFTAKAVTNFSPIFSKDKVFLNGRVLSSNGMILSVALFS